MMAGAIAPGNTTGANPPVGGESMVVMQTMDISPNASGVRARGWVSCMRANKTNYMERLHKIIGCDKLGAKQLRARVGVETGGMGTGDPRE